MNANDKVKIEFYVHGDDRWEIDYRTSFSIILLTPQRNGFIVFRPAVTKILQSDPPHGEILSGWESVESPSPLYGSFLGTTKSSPILQDASNIKFSVDGWYTVSLNIILQGRSRTTNNKAPPSKITLELIENHTNNNKDWQVTHSILCDELVLDFEVTTAGCQFSQRFRRGDVYNVRIRTSDGPSWTAKTINTDPSVFYNQQTNDQNMAYLSVVLLDEVVSFQSGLLNLQVNFTLNYIKHYYPMDCKFY